MNTLIPSFQAECIKWRRNWAPVAAVLIPSTQVAFIFLLFWFSEDRVSRMGPGFYAWYLINYSVWTFLFLPITAALVPWITWDMEGTSRTWKHVMVQPVQRTNHFMVKIIGHFILIYVAQIIMCFLTLIGGLLLRKYVPVLAMGEPALILFFRFAGLSFLAPLPLVCLHTWLSMRFRNIGVALVVAVGGTWITTQLMISQLWYINFSPWSLAVQTIALAHRSTNFLIPTLTTIICAILLLSAGSYDFSRYNGPRE